MTDYVPPDPSLAEYVHNKNEEMLSYRRRLEPLSDEELKAIVRNQDEGDTRPWALGILMERLARARGLDTDSRRAQLAEMLDDFLEDPHPQIAKMAAHRYGPLTEQQAGRIYKMIDSSHDQVKAASVMTLARNKDERLLPKLLEWFHGSNEGYRNIAIQALAALGIDRGDDELRKAYDEGGRDERDRVVLAIALLGMGDDRGVDYLKDVARRAKGQWSCVAATGLYRPPDPDVGLQLMLHILDRGDNEAKQWMVNQICFNFIQSPHAFTVDGIHEARLWVQRKLELSDKSPTP